MRVPNRIPIIRRVLNEENKTKYIEYLGLGDLSDDILSKWSKCDENELYNFWLDYPDLRLTQVLVEFNIIPNTPGFWFYVEEVNFLIESHILEPRDVLFWGQNYDKDNNKLPETIYKPIKELDTEHIKSILSNVKNISSKYIDAFNNELKLRDR